MNRDAIESGLEFVERCVSERDIRALVDAFQARIRDFGFTHAACGGWVGLAKSRVYRFFFNEWPADWLDLYTRRGFMTEDPFVLEVRRRMTPFSLRDIDETRVTPRGREALAALYDYGWREAIGFPIHGPAGYQGLVSVASMETLSLQPRHIAMLHLMAISVHDRCRAALDFGMPTQPLPRLSTREIEVMQWVAVGKTDADIAQLLGISAATAHYHVEQAKRKLGKSSRTEAVALLVLHGLI